MEKGTWSAPPPPPTTHPAPSTPTVSPMAMTELWTRSPAPLGMRRPLLSRCKHCRCPPAPTPRLPGGHLSPPSPAFLSTFPRRGGIKTRGTDRPQHPALLPSLLPSWPPEPSTQSFSAPSHENPKTWLTGRGHKSPAEERSRDALGCRASRKWDGNVSAYIPGDS